MASDNVEIGISLDNSDALLKTMDLSKALDSLGDAVGVKELATSFGKLTIVIAAVNKAMELMHAALDFAKEGEKLRAIETSFSNLSRSMGVSADTMLAGLDRVSKGTLDQTDAMKMASAAMVKLGSESGKIPELFAVAKNAARLFGGTAEEQFDKITTAIARQRTGQLAAIGIHINADQVLKEYAHSIGKGAENLTEFEKRHAILNETLKVGQKNIEASGKATSPLNLAFKQMSVAVNDLKETIQKIAYEKLGEKFAESFRSKTSIIKNITDEVNASMGAGMDQINAQISVNQKELARLETQRAYIASQIKSSVGTLKVAQEEALTGITAKAEMLKIQLEDLEKTKRRLTTQEPAAAGKPVGVSAEEEAARREAETKRLRELMQFESARVQLAQDGLNKRMELVTQEDAFNNLFEEKKAILAQNAHLQLLKLSQDETIDSEHKAQLRLQIEQNLALELRKLQLNRDSMRLTSIANIEKAENASTAKLVAGFQAATEKMKMGSLDFTSAFTNAFDQARGAVAGMFGQLGQMIGQGFTDMGESSKHAAEKMALFMLGAIGDIATAFGTMLMMRAPAGEYWLMAIGAALVTFGGVLKGVSAGLSKNLGSAPAASGGGSAPKMESLPSFDDKKKDNKDEERRLAQEQRERERLEREEERRKEKEEREREREAERAEKERLMAAREMEKFYEKSGKAVSVEIHGNYFETEQTKTRLMDIIRQASDSQDFRLSMVGG